MNNLNTFAQLYFFYKITCKDPLITRCYIGKTKRFIARCANHKTNSKENTLKLYAYIREHGGWDNWEINVIHQEFCSVTSTTLIEYALIKQHGADLNMQMPNVYKRQEYNRRKCKEHYAIKKQCACGWEGSKMEWSHHIHSKKHKKYCIDVYEEIEKIQPYQEIDQLETNSYGINYSPYAETDTEIKPYQKIDLLETNSYAELIEYEILN